MHAAMPPSVPRAGEGDTKVAASRGTRRAPAHQSDFRRIVPHTARLTCSPRGCTISRRYGTPFHRAPRTEDGRLCTGRSPGSRLERLFPAFPSARTRTISGMSGQACRLQLRGQPRLRDRVIPDRVPFSSVDAVAGSAPRNRYACSQRRPPATCQGAISNGAWATAVRRDRSTDPSSCKVWPSAELLRLRHSHRLFPPAPCPTLSGRASVAAAAGE